MRRWWGEAVDIYFEGGEVVWTNKSGFFFGFEPSYIDKNSL